MSKSYKILIDHLILVLVILLLIFCRDSATYSINSIDRVPKSSLVRSLTYGEFLFLESECDNYVEWSFLGSNLLVGLDAYIFNEDNFEKFTDGQVISFYHVSNGSLNSHEGNQSVDHKDTWYFVVAHFDDNQVAQSTIVNYSAIFHNKSPNPERVAAVIIGFVAGMSIFGIFGIILYKNDINIKRKKEKELQEQIEDFTEILDEKFRDWKQRDKPKE